MIRPWILPDRPGSGASGRRRRPRIALEHAALTPVRREGLRPHHGRRDRRGVRRLAADVSSATTAPRKTSCSPTATSGSRRLLAEIAAPPRPTSLPVRAIQARVPVHDRGTTPRNRERLLLRSRHLRRQPQPEVAQVRSANRAGKKRSTTALLEREHPRRRRGGRRSSFGSSPARRWRCLRAALHQWLEVGGKISPSSSTTRSTIWPRVLSVHGVRPRAHVPRRNSGICAAGKRARVEVSLHELRNRGAQSCAA